MSSYITTRVSLPERRSLRSLSRTLINAPVGQLLLDWDRHGMSPASEHRPPDLSSSSRDVRPSSSQQAQEYGYSSNIRPPIHDLLLTTVIEL
jgi:hypothetical protein